MSSMRLDIYHSQIPNNAVYLTFNGLGSGENTLRSLGSGKQVTLKRGTVRRNAILLFRENGESFTNEMEMSSKLAGALSLRSHFRYLVTYDSAANVLAFVPSPISIAQAKLKSNYKANLNRILIGYELLSKLGIPENRSQSVVCRSQSASIRLTVSSPSNLFDNGLGLDPAVIRALHLVPDSHVTLSYNQNTKVLAFKAAKPPGSAQNRTGGAS
jgi:hypothetical protein